MRVPPELLTRYNSWSWSAVSVHPGNSATYRVSNGRNTTLFLKVVRRGWTPNAEAEAARLIWAHRYLPVPELIESGSAPESSWILTNGIEALDATSESFRSDVTGLVRHLAVGLRAFHESLPLTCPFHFRLADALCLVRDRLASGLIDPTRDFHAEHAHLTAEAAVAALHEDSPDSEHLVVCHGDYCVPNILIRDDHVVGYVDLGELGVADRWWDLAVATWSVTWNFGPGYEARFLEAYGVDRDDERIRYYRLLYDVVS